MSTLATLIVICGAPALGKTTLARRLARDLRLPLLEKESLSAVLRRWAKPRWLGAWPETFGSHFWRKM
jgi:adenylate kinase family enzyme